jgi:hypothetical protein|tara:strand:- start:622 stop:1098 length:477 start_codon:yes stop_codon:yes gene_type:complete
MSESGFYFCRELTGKEIRGKVKINFLIFISVFFCLFFVGPSYGSASHVGYSHQSHVSPFDKSSHKKNLRCLLSKRHHLVHCLLKKISSDRTFFLQAPCGGLPSSQMPQGLSFQKKFPPAFNDCLNLPQLFEVSKRLIPNFKGHIPFFGSPPIPPPRFV